MENQIDLRTETEEVLGSLMLQLIELRARTKALSNQLNTALTAIEASKTANVKKND